ncbi:MAG TPA: YezD family protein [Vicinamibacteria bacterium]|nr:YezD family protein [Vicinamibacteria bacterium]
MTHATEDVGTGWERAVVEAIRALRFGSIEIVVHEGRVVQIETREKVRFDEAGRRRPDTRGRE